MNKWKSNKGLKAVMAALSVLTAAISVCSAIAVSLIGDLGAYSGAKEERLEELYEKYSEIYSVMAIANRESPLMQEDIDKTNFRYGIIKAQDLETVDISDPESYEYYNFETMPGEDAIEKEEVRAEEFVVGEGVNYSWECRLFGYAGVHYEAENSEFVEETKDVPITGYYYNVSDGIFYYGTDEEFYRVDEVTLPVAKINGTISFIYDSGQKAYYNMNPDECLVNGYYLTFNEFDNTEKSWETWDNIILDGLEFGHTDIRFVNDEYTYMGELAGKPISDHYYLSANGYGTLTVKVQGSEAAEGYEEEAREHYWVVSMVRDPLVKTGIHDNFLDGDLFEQITYLLDLAYGWRYTMIIILAAALILWAVSTVLVLIMAGHKGSYETVDGTAPGEGGLPEEEENTDGFKKAERRWADAVKPGIWQKIPLDVETGVFVVLGSCFTMIFVEFSYYYYEYWWNIALTVLSGAACYILCFIWLTDFAVRIKLGKWWRSMLIYRCFAWIVRKLKKGFRFFQRNISFLWKAVLVLCGINILECFGIALTGHSPEIELGLWFFYRGTTVILILIGIAQANELKEGAGKLAEGNLQEKIDTKKMFWEFRKHGENLNSIQEGISLAVEKRMQSEHFRTELITNVSHDIKTPLTSIINYVDLLQKEEIDNEKAKEYLEVLSRQSARLKKLTEDLIEASKASTGSMPVQMERLELGVFLTQTVGEFEEKMAEAGLRVVMNKPEQEVFVNADGRHLWRVVENLVQNICKYAQPDTRVYIDLDENEKEAVISFKNISRYELNISGEALMERFIRGDASRHTEGSGLGLSIAGSLMELMRGRLEIVVDGDLFKVVLHFPK